MKIPDTLKWKYTSNTIGEGGQAQVYEVIDKTENNGNTYALKVLSKGKPQRAYERFYNEIKAIKQVQHPNIIKIYDHSIKGDEFNFYVMEYIKDAIPLKKLLQTGKNPFYKNPLKSIEMFMQLLEVIRECEKIGIVHRDISPANILILADNSIKVIDFGLCQIEGEETLTLIDEGVGTPLYMAPECEAGSEGIVTSRSDIYSAGKILWSAITNFNAFSRESPVFNAKSMKAVFPSNPNTWHLHHIFEKTIRRDPATRWENAEKALDGCRRVYQVILSGYSPLELIGDFCPICGIGELFDFDGSHMVFGNPNPPGIQGVQCNYCGYCFAISYKKIRENLNIREKLE